MKSHYFAALELRIYEYADKHTKKEVKNKGGQWQVIHHLCSQSRLVKHPDVMCWLIRVFKLRPAKVPSDATWLALISLFLTQHGGATVLMDPEEILYSLGLLSENIQFDGEFWHYSKLWTNCTSNYFSFFFLLFIIRTTLKWHDPNIPNRMCILWTSDLVQPSNPTTSHTPKDDTERYLRMIKIPLGVGCSLVDPCWENDWSWCQAQRLIEGLRDCCVLSITSSRLIPLLRPQHTTAALGTQRWSMWWPQPGFILYFLFQFLWLISLCYCLQQAEGREPGRKLYTRTGPHKLFHSKDLKQHQLVVRDSLCETIVNARKYITKRIL